MFRRLGFLFGYIMEFITDKVDSSLDSFDEGIREAVEKYWLD